MKVLDFLGSLSHSIIKMLCSFDSHCLFCLQNFKIVYMRNCNNCTHFIQAAKIALGLRRDGVQVTGVLLSLRRLWEYAVVLGALLHLAERAAEGSHNYYQDSSLLYWRTELSPAPSKHGDCCSAVNNSCADSNCFSRNLIPFLLLSCN